MSDRKTIAIVGGTAGIGAAIAKHALSKDLRVVVGGRRTPNTADSNTEYVAIDVADEASIINFFEKVGDIDFLTTPASYVRPSGFRGSAIDDARTTIDGKFFSQYTCARYAKVRESMLFFSGIYSRRPAAGYASLAAANAAVEALARALAIELAPLRVNTISPGLVRDTEAFAHLPSDAREQMFTAVGNRLPVATVYGPDAIAEMALAILLNPYVTGTVVDVDGGSLLS